jgi:hypothetical protein
VADQSHSFNGSVDAQLTTSEAIEVEGNVLVSGFRYSLITLCNSLRRKACCNVDLQARTESMLNDSMT